MKSGSITLGAIAALALSGVSITGLNEVVHPPVRPAGLEVHETHAAASLLGQFRTSISSWLWLRTDLYLHNGTEMRRLSEAELNAGERDAAAQDDGHRNLDEEGITGVIPHAGDDFRGLLGDVERQVKTYKRMEGHVHNDPTAALPLYRLMTWADPHFVPGWVIGAAVISRGRTDEAIRGGLKFLEQGRVENPDSLSILTEIARLEIRLGQTRSAIDSLERVANLADKRFRNLPEEDLDATVDCFRWLALVYRAEGEFEASERAAQRGEKLIPDDLILRRLAHPAPSIYSNDDYADWNSKLGIPVDAPALSP